MKCNNCKKEFEFQEIETSDITISIGVYNQSEFMQITIYCPGCDDEVRWSRIQESDFINI